MGTTSPFGFPWPEPNLPVRDGAANIRSLAESVNDKMNARGLLNRFEIQRITITPNAFGNAVITFARPFTNLPVCIAWVWGDNNTGRWATFAGSQITNAYIGTFLYRQNGTIETSAVQMQYFAYGQDTAL